MSRIHSQPRMPAPSVAFFLSGIVFLCVGVALGLFMSMTHDYGLRPVHAHTNLLGWVSSAIMGLFHAQARHALRPRLVWFQYATYTSGVILMMIGLTGVLGGHTQFMPAVHLGVVGTVIGILIFGWAIVRTAIARPEASPAWPPG